MLLFSLRKQLQARHRKPPEDCTTLEDIMLSTVSAEGEGERIRKPNGESPRKPPIGA